MSGFVYLWFDRKNKRYYVGSHWGPENDGYVCSSRWMRNAYKRRSHDFKRRIIARISSSRKDLLKEEERFLMMIKLSEMKKKYYNLKRGHIGHWSDDDKKRLTVGQKISASPNRAANISKANKGKVRSEDFKKRISITLTGRKGLTPSLEHRLKISLSQRGKPRQKHSKETKQKISEALKGRIFSKEHKKNLRLAEQRKRDKHNDTSLQVSRERDARRSQACS